MRRIVGRLKGHFGNVWGICFTPDGKRLVSAGLDRTVRLWDLSEGKEVSLLGLHEKSVLRIAISPDGRLAASTGFDHVVKVWNLDPPGLLQTFRGHEARVWDAAFHPNGLLLATSGGDGTVRFWKVPQRPEEWVLEGVDAWSFGFSSKRRLLFGLISDGHIDVWDVATRTQIIHVPGDHAWWVPDSESIVFIRGGQLIELDVPTKSEQILGTAGESAEGLGGTRSSFDGRLLAWRHSDHVHVIDRISRIELARLETGAGRTDVIAFSGDGTILATAGGGNSVIQFWDTATWRRTKSLQGQQMGITTICFSPNGLVELASSSPDRTVRLWHLSTGEYWDFRDDEGEPGSLAFSPDGRTLATGTYEGSVKLWDVTARQQIASFAAGVSWLKSLHFAPDGSALGSTTFDRKVRVWQAPTWAEINVAATSVEKTGRQRP